MNHDTPAPAARSLAPDIARGMVLLLIASANVVGYLWSAEGYHEAGWRPLGGSSLDHVVDGIVSFVADGRSKPMFAILYGFGFATMASRLAARGADRRATRRVLARRSVALVVLGLLHAALLYGGDILAPYGATGLVALAYVHRSRATLARWFAAGCVLTVVALAVVTFSGATDDGTAGTLEPTSPTYLSTMVETVAMVATASTLFAVTLSFVPHVVVGILLARSGWLTRPADHRRRLGQVAAGAGVVNLVGALPYSLAVARAWHPGDTALGIADVLPAAVGAVRAAAEPLGARARGTDEHRGGGRARGRGLARHGRRRGRAPPGGVARAVRGGAPEARLRSTEVGTGPGGCAGARHPGVRSGHVCEPSSTSRHVVATAASRFAAPSRRADARSLAPRTIGTRAWTPCS